MDARYEVPQKYIHNLDAKKASLFVLVCSGSTRATASSFTGSIDHTQWRTTAGRTHMDEWSACRWDLYLKTHNIHKTKTSRSPVGFETTISEGERPQTYNLHSAGPGTSKNTYSNAELILARYLLMFRERSLINV